MSQTKLSFPITVFNFENTPGVLQLFSVRVNSLWCWINFLSKLPLQPSNCHSGLPRTASARATRMRAPSAKRLPKALDEHWCHDYNQIIRLSGYESSHSYHMDLTAHRSYVAKTGVFFFNHATRPQKKEHKRPWSVMNLVAGSPHISQSFFI